MKTVPTLSTQPTLFLNFPNLGIIHWHRPGQIKALRSLGGLHQILTVRQWRQPSALFQENGGHPDSVAMAAKVREVSLSL